MGSIYSFEKVILILVGESGCGKTTGRKRGKRLFRFLSIYAEAYGKEDGFNGF